MSARPRAHDHEAEHPPPRSRLAYRLTEAAHELSIGRTTLYRMIADEELHTVTIRGMRRVLWEELDRVRKLRSGSRSPTDLPGPLPGPGFPQI